MYFKHVQFGISDALLADLQSSVPGQKNPLHQPYIGQNGNATSGYGSLRPKQPPQLVRSDHIYFQICSNLIETVSHLQIPFN